ncbi:MAG: UDP-diphosphatase [Alistipes sp. 58_9_plus]|nr:MAG: UDP-diphosphatase [Alistipes sp. 58_9_plus]
MSIIDAILLGAVQGLTEFLPVSSSGHLQIAKELLGIEMENNVTFDLSLHVATVLSTIVVLWGTIKHLFTGLFSKPYNDDQRYIVKIIISMVPVGDYIEAAFASLTVVGAMLLLTAVLLTFAYYAKPRAKKEISYRDAFIIGLAQAAATMPGLSRSGTTIATGLLLGNRKDEMAQFSFLMVLPPILGNALLDLMKGDFGGSVGTLPLVAGFLSSFLVGCAACKFMIEIVKRGKLIYFAIYCAVIGAITLIGSFA